MSLIPCSVQLSCNRNFDMASSGVDCCGDHGRDCGRPQGHDSGFALVHSGYNWAGTGGRVIFGLFGSAQAKRGDANIAPAPTFHEFSEYNVEAEALGLT